MGSNVVLENGDTVYIDKETGKFLQNGDLPNYTTGDGRYAFWVQGTLQDTTFFVRKDGPNLREFKDDGVNVQAWVRGRFANPEFFNPTHSQTLATVFSHAGEREWTRAWVQGLYTRPVFVIRKRGRPNWLHSSGVSEWRAGDYYGPVQEYAQRHDRPVAVDTVAKVRRYAVGGKLVGDLPIKPTVPWSSCTKHAKLQLGGTCASTAVLNLFLNTPLLRNACISRTLELFKAHPGLEDGWRHGDLEGSAGNFRATLLQTVYYEMCAQRGQRVPTAVTVSSHCLFSSLFTNLGKGAGPYIRNSAIVLDLMHAAGFHHLFVNVPEMEIDDVVLGLTEPERTYFIYTRMFDAEGGVFGETAPEPEKGPIAVFGSLIFFQRMAADSNIGHVVAGLKCAKAKKTPVVFDSNVGELPINWMQDADAFHANLTRTYGALRFVHQMFLYATIDVQDAAAQVPFEAACMGTAGAGFTSVGAAKPTGFGVLTLKDRIRLYDALTSTETLEFHL